MGWVNETRTMFDASSSYMESGISNYFEFFEKLRFRICDWKKSSTMILIKSKREKQNGFLYTWLKSQVTHDLNHKSSC